MNEMGRRWDADIRHTGTRDAYMGDLGTRWERAEDGIGRSAGRHAPVELEG